MRISPTLSDPPFCETIAQAPPPLFRSPSLYLQILAV